MSDLKPCKCGNTNIDIFAGLRGEMPWVVCKICKAHTEKFAKRPDAIRAWNEMVSEEKEKLHPLDEAILRIADEIREGREFNGVLISIDSGTVWKRGSILKSLALTELAKATMVRDLLETEKEQEK